jgi:hypothetical protein
MAPHRSCNSPVTAYEFVQPRQTLARMLLKLARLRLTLAWPRLGLVALRLALVRLDVGPYDPRLNVAGMCLSSALPRQSPV